MDGEIHSAILTWTRAGRPIGLRRIQHVFGAPAVLLWGKGKFFPLNFPP